MLSEYIKSDLQRYAGKATMGMFFKHYFISPGFKYSFYLRLCKYYRKKNKLVYLFFRILLRHYSYKFGFDIPVMTTIGFGLYIGHFGNVVISSKAVIGDNCNISQGVTIGYNPRGKFKGYPIIGNNVFIGPGAVVIGNVNIGDNVAIGANCVVTKNFSKNDVVTGIPGTVISTRGNDEYIINRWVK
ncbi:hexapeptide transferase family protein [Arcticibacter svalbardensis MN12-7]|uniref:Serine acetyltransferase n=1 Tax=Arcticibacter svalbardensis MN12-7 TaxID=1150600 RepID=R9GRB3_9SPHI|nr:DapH/DapD/GlmU-related protein [Arcticibacter svalbardensis]EOR94080.1 hexapeptide transferase family protein [Arcticibacter svalbardensis MN12-7]